MNVLHLLDFPPGSPVETSAFNAEAPTEPAGETVGCRRQLGGIVKHTNSFSYGRAGACSRRSN